MAMAGAVGAAGCCADVSGNTIRRQKRTPRIRAMQTPWEVKAQKLTLEQGQSRCFRTGLGGLKLAKNKFDKGISEPARSRLPPARYTCSETHIDYSFIYRTWASFASRLASNSESAAP